MPKVSVIIPVYNAEKYLRECLDSVLAQTFTDFEVLLINDGSTDGSGKICDEYAEKDSRIKVFHKENGGVSSARNLGLDNAKGEWICFVDSDDTIEQETLATLANEVKDLDIDGVIFGYKKLINNKVSVYEFANKNKSISLSKDDALLYMYKSKYYPYQGYAWTKFFKNDIIDKFGIRFNEAIFYNEDRLFCFEYFSKTEKPIKYTLKDLYVYRINSLSAYQVINSTYSTKFETDIQGYLEMQKIVLDNNYTKLMRPARMGVLFGAKRLLDLRRKHKVEKSEIDLNLKNLMKENFKIRDFLGRRIRLGYKYWEFIKTL